MTVCDAQGRVWKDVIGGYVKGRVKSCHLKMERSALQVGAGGGRTQVGRSDSPGTFSLAGN